MAKHAVFKLAMGLALVAPMVAQAESQLVLGAGTATAKLNFRVIIPRVLFLGVGSGSALPLATNTTVDTVTFDYTANAAAVGTGAAAATITGNVVPVRVFGNNGQIIITATNPANLVSGVNTIPFTSLSAVSSDATNFAVPAFGGGTSSPVLSAGRVTSRNATWTYSYANTVNASAGTYDGQATYTATMP